MSTLGSSSGFSAKTFISKVGIVKRIWNLWKKADVVLGILTIERAREW